MRKDETMSSKERRRRWAFEVGVLGFVAISLGCSQQPNRHVVKTNNLVNVDCKKHDPYYAGKTPIVVNATDGIKYEDEIVFVCDGEKIHWEAGGSGIKSIDVHFQNSEWPFKEPFTPQLHGDGQTPTPDLEVGPLPTNFRAKAFKYQIHVVTSSGSIDLDPHIIHGGGGP